MYQKLTIDASSIAYNFNYIKERVKDVIVPLKANAYGFGYKNIAPILLNAGCNKFAVAYIDEGISLRKFLLTEFKTEPEIFVLNVTSSDFLLCEEYNLIPVLNTIKDVYLCKNPYCLHIDTYMNRLGVPFDDYLKNLDLIKSKDFKIIFSHLSSGDIKEHDSNKIQLERTNILKKNHPNAKISLSNSGGFLLSKEYYFDIVRPGICIYGINPSNSIENPFVHAYELKAKVLQTKWINENEYVGYNCTFKTQKKSKIGTIAIGYADGIPWNFYKNGYVLFEDQKAAIVGKISMDLITVDMTNITKDSDYATILSKDLTICSIAKEVGTSPYEICTRISKRAKLVTA